MSRGKQARRRRYPQSVSRAAAGSTEAAERTGHQPTARKERLIAAERRAGLAKAGLAATGAVVFGVAMAFARHSYAGHPKTLPKPLSAPPRFVSVVRENLLQAGIVAPAEAPPGATTGAS